MTARRRERGGAAVEAALIVPLFVLLSIGLAEYGMVWSSANAVADALGGASLQVARNLESRAADERALQTIAGTLGSLDEVSWVLIYRTSAADGGPSASCLAVARSLTAGSSGVSGACNAYHGEVLGRLDSLGFSGPTCDGDADRWFCPSTRSSVVGQGERIGVALGMRHRWMFGMFPGGGQSWEDRAVSVPQIP